MPVLNYGQSNFGINLDVGRYTARFLGTESRPPIEGGQFGNSGEPRMAFIWEVTEGPKSGERIIQETGTMPSPKSECARMLLGLAGRELRVNEKIDTDSFLNRVYSVKVSVNPKSDKGRLHVGDLEPLTNGAATAPALAPAAPRPSSPPPRPSAARTPATAAPAQPAARYFVDHETKAFDETVSADELNALIQAQGCKASELAVLREGDGEWRTAAHYGFGDGPIPN